MLLLMANGGFEHFIGRLHPLLLHFPIAFLLLAALLEGVRYLCGRREKPSPSASTCLWAGLLTAAAAVWAGWELAEQQGDAGDAIGLHRWTAIACLVAATLAAAAWVMRTIRGRDWTGPHVAMLLLSGVLVAVSGHFGAELVWGEGWILSPLKASEPSQDAGPSATWAQVEPILADHCAKCHGATRQKGGLRLVPWTALFAGDPAEWVVRAGDPDASLMHQAIVMPASEEGAMPPEGKADPLSDLEVETITMWIRRGARGPDGQSPPEPTGPAAGDAAGAAARGDHDA
ncbi:MAG: c-type cytochrome domain-containing protein [Phycisphaerales bacterium]|jgi:uncharacterized membrane protein/cytochrome c5|nr:c-type cytochrome domain-containing protein [Phycisphaerales bacterium]